MSLPPSIRGSLLVLSAASVLAAAGCIGAPASDDAEAVGSTYQSFDEWKAGLPPDPDGGGYLVEGRHVDAGDDATLKQLFAAHGQPGALIINKREDGSDDRWSDAQKMNLTYCVSPSFGDAHDAVVDAMQAAGDEWTSAAAVRFVYHGEEDQACTSENDRVLFEVVPVSGTAYNARSFFPSSAAQGDHEIRVDMDNIMQSQHKSLHGVLAHELGHVLGFRHEHARPESNGVCAEGPGWRALTPYDPDSVMHYNAYSPCAGTNGGDYHLSELDRKGAAEVYGSPGQQGY